METYAFLPREAVTAFLMGCPQCSTNNAGGSGGGGNAAVDDPQQPQLPVSAGFCQVAVEQCSFACSTPVKREAFAAVVAGNTTVTADKENVTDNGAPTGSNKRKRTVPTKRGRRPCEVVTDASTGSSTLKNSSNSSGTLALLSSSSSSFSSSKTDHSGRLSGGWWSKGSASSRPIGVGNFGAVNNVPLDLSSSSPLSSAVSTIRRSSSPSVVEDFFFKRRRVRRRRLRSKRLSRSCRGRRYEDATAADDDDDDDTSVSGGDVDDHDEVMRDSNHGIEGVKYELYEAEGCPVGGVEVDQEDDGLRPAKVMRTCDGAMVMIGDFYNENNNDDGCYDKTGVVVTAETTMTTTAADCCVEDRVTADVVAKGSIVEVTTREKEARSENRWTGADESNGNEVSG